MTLSLSVQTADTTTAAAVLPATAVAALHIGLEEDAGVDGSRLGQCYVLAGQELMFKDRENAVLIHGVIGWEEQNPHAWLEYDVMVDWPPDKQTAMRMVWEPVSTNELPLDAFVRLFQAEALYSYNLEQMLKLAVQTKHWGPWEGSYWRLDLSKRVKRPNGS